MKIRLWIFVISLILIIAFDYGNWNIEQNDIRTECNYSDDKVYHPYNAEQGHCNLSDNLADKCLFDETLQTSYICLQGRFLSLEINFSINIEQVYLIVTSLENYTLNEKSIRATNELKYVGIPIYSNRIVITRGNSSLRIYEVFGFNADWEGIEPKIVFNIDEHKYIFKWKEIINFLNKVIK